MKAQFVTIDGLRTRYLTAGRGHPIVLVHPVGYPAEVFARTMTGLAHTFQCIAPDLPGQGFTEAPAQWHSAPQVMMADHVAKLVRVLGVDTFSVVGSSLGGLVAALLALRHPEGIRNLVLVGTGSVFNDPCTQPAILKQVYANGSRAYADPSQGTLRSRLASTCHSLPDADDVLLATMTAYAWPGAAEAYRVILEGVIDSVGDPQTTVYHRLEAIRVRCLVVIGMNDVRSSHQAHERGARRMPNARLVAIENCGHLPFLERPTEFNAELEAFLEPALVRDEVRRSAMQRPS